MGKIGIKREEQRVKGLIAVLIFLGLFCLGVGQANGATKYVNINTGSDGNTGTQASPFKTITKALNSVANGDTILVAAGIYSKLNGETIPIELPGAAAPFPSNVSLIGESPTSTIIDAEDAEENCIQNGLAASPTNFLISNFTIKGAKQTALVDGGYGIYFSMGSYTVVNNVIIDNRTGIYISGNSTIENNTIDSNAQDGIACNYATATIKNNIITNNGNHGINVVAGASPTTDYNDVWNNTKDYNRVSSGTHDISADPLFVNRAGGDYHLKSCSPCIDRGDPASEYSNEPKPDGNRINIGAYGNTLEAANNPEASAEADEPVCLNGTLRLYGNVIGGTGPYTYLWEGPGNWRSAQQHPTRTPPVAGTYDLTVTDAYGCDDTGSVVVTVNPTPTADAGADVNVCSGTCTTIGGLPAARGGTEPYTYLWTPTTGLDNANTCCPTACPDTTTTYTLTVEDANGCTDDDQVVVTVNPKPTASTASNSPICESSTIELTGGLNGMRRYSWVGPGGWTSSDQNPIRPNATVAMGGIYTLTVEDANGCTDDDQVVVTVNTSTVAADFFATTTAGCAPLTVDFADSSTGDVLSYLWSFGDGDTDTVQNPTHTYNNPGTYTVFLTVSDTCGSDTETKPGYIVVTGQSPTAKFTVDDTSPCSGQLVCFTDQSTGSPTSWSWDLDGDGQEDTTVQEPCWTFHATGDCTPVLVVSNNCGSDTEIKIGYITVNPCITGLTLTKSSEPWGDTNCQEIIHKGDTITYTLKYECWGETGAANVVIIDYLDSPGLTVVDTGRATYNAADHTLTWDIPHLDPSDSDDLIFVARVSADTGVCIKNYASISADNADTLTSDTITHYVLVLSSCTMYVDGVNGDDTNDGLTPATAKRTIAAGVNTVCEGGTVYVASDTYTGTVTLNKVVSLIGADSPTTVIKGSSPVVVFDGVGGSISGFTITGGNYGIQCNDGANPTISNNIIANNSSYPVYISGPLTPNLNNNTYLGNNPDLIYINGGVMTTSDTWTKDGVPYLISGPVYVKGADSPTLTIDPGVEMRFSRGEALYIGGNSAGEYGKLTADGSGDTIIFTGSSASPGHWYGIHFLNHSLDTSLLKNVIVEYGAYGATGPHTNIYCDNASPTIRDSVIRNSGQYGINLNNSFPTIINNIIIENNSSGIYCSSSSPTVTNNTITDNSGSGIYCNPSDPIITNNIITSNNSSGIYAGGSSSPVIRYNDVWSNSPNYSGCSAGPGDISADPKFVNAANSDFHLLYTSPCINAGINTADSMPAQDKDGNPRIVNNIVDMGVYEYQGTPYRATLTLTKSSDPYGDTTCTQQVFKGDTITYTLKYECWGDTGATNTKVVNHLDSGVTYLHPIGASEGVYDTPTHTLTWNLGNLSPGDSAARTFTCEVTADSGTCIQNYATISADNIDTVTSDTITHRVSSVTANAGPDDTVCSGSCTTLNGSASGGTPDYIYFWTSSPADFTSSDSITIVCPTTTTTYTLTVTDSSGCSNTDQVVVRVNESLIETEIVALSLTGCAPLTVNFSDSTSGDVLSFLWDFGDGDTSTLKNPTHTYNNPGTYTVTLTASDTCGSDTDQVVVRVDPCGVILKNVWTLTSLPFIPSEPDTASIYGQSADVYHWNPEKDEDTSTLKYEVPSSIEIGKGYWVKVVTETAIPISGTLSDTSCTIPLYPYWNQIGCPFNFEVDWSSVRFTKDGVEKAPQEAEEAGWITNAIYWYEEGEGYLYGPSEPYLNPRLSPWKGYWISANEEVTLRIPKTPTSGSLAYFSSKRALDEESWSIQLTVESGGVVDRLNFIGTRPEGYGRMNAKEPPAPIGSYIRLSFPKSTGIYTSDYRLPIQEKEVWDFVVNSNLTDKKVTLSWRNIEEVPNEYDLTLLDKQTGKSLDMRKTSSYTTEGQSFSVIVQRQSSTKPELVSEPFCYPNPVSKGADGKTTLVTKLSSGTEVKARIYDIAGELVKEIPLDENGEGTWNLTNDKGKKVASGVYLFCIEVDGKMMNKIGKIAVRK